MDIHAPAVHAQPGTAVEDPAAPTPDVEHLAPPVQVPKVAGVKAFAVVDADVPIAIHARRPGAPGAAQSDGPYARQRSEGVCDVVHERRLVHLTMLGSGSASNLDLRCLRG